MNKRFFIFLSLVILLGSLHSQVTLAQTKTLKYNHSAFDNENSDAQALNGLNITLHPGSDFTQEAVTPAPRSLNHCKSLVYRTLKNLPPEAAAQLKNLTLYFSNTGRRGFGGGTTVVLRCLPGRDAEQVSVFLHEMSHLLASSLQNKIVSEGSQGSLKFGREEEYQFHDGETPIPNDSLTAKFYRLSFVDEKTIRPESSAVDFVSGYAMTDPFEDFAESNTFYLLHGNEFRQLIKTSKVLYEKYVFLKTRVYNGQEFSLDDASRKVQVTRRNYDTTVLAYDLNRFFAGIRET